jgi:hypothetical protein
LHSNSNYALSVTRGAQSHNTGRCLKWSRENTGKNAALEWWRGGLVD